MIAFSSRMLLLRLFREHISRSVSRDSPSSVRPGRIASLATFDNVVEKDVRWSQPELRSRSVTFLDLPSGWDVQDQRAVPALDR